MPTKTVFLTTHYLDEAQELADRVAIIRAGKIIVEGAPDALGAGDEQTEILFVVPAGVGLDELPVEETARIVDGRAQLNTRTPTRTLAALCGWAAQRGIELERLEVRRPSLEDIYLELVAEGEREPDAEVRS